MGTPEAASAEPMEGEAEDRSPANTRERVLDAAERLFAEHGLERVSIRDITRAAAANLAAINYHFGTKQGLIAAMLDRRLSPLNQARLEALDAAQAAAATQGEPLAVRVVLDAFIRPAVEQGMALGRDHLVFMKLLGRCVTESDASSAGLLHAHFDVLMRRFEAALAQAAPHLSEGEIRWRMHMMLGALKHLLLLADTPCGNQLTENVDLETQVRRLVAFSTAGFQAPAEE